jgi:hypothetical protein
MHLLQDKCMRALWRFAIDYSYYQQPSSPTRFVGSFYIQGTCCCMQDYGRDCSSSNSLEKFFPGKDRPVNSISVSLWQMTIGPWGVALGPSQTFTERAQRCRACCIWLMCSRSVQSSSATWSSMLHCRYASVENRRRPERRGQPSPAWPRKTLLKGPDFAQNRPLRSNTSQRSQVVDGHGHRVRNRRKPRPS